MTVHVNLRSSDWQKSNNGLFKKRGTCFLSTASLLDAKTNDSVLKELAGQNGFYALVWRQGNITYAAVDHVRSIPLFYGLNGQQFYLSDDAEWVREKVGNTEMDPVAQEEFQLAGYVTGQETLYPDVKQLQAGEFLAVNHDGEAPALHTERYYRFLHTEPGSIDEPRLRRRLEVVAFKALQRLVDHAGGRQLVLPLSGGYDSRLIATILKRLGYENVLCFTYGVPGNREARFSQQVAESLGYEWAFVQYSADDWKTAWRTKEAERYRHTAANHASLPHVQDWLAIRELISTGQVTNSSIIVPGHSGDFVAGSHIPEFAFASTEPSEEELLQALVKDHLSNASTHGMNLDSQMLLYQRLRNRIGIPFDGSNVAVANAYELWDWQERQSKYIVNSVRVYEQFGLEWWLPLWDLDFLRFWQEVPLDLRKGRVWFKSWIDEQYAILTSEVDLGGTLGNAADNPKSLEMLKVISNILPLSIKNYLVTLWASRKAKNHFLGFEGLVTEGDVKRYYLEGYNMIGIYSLLYIKGRW